MLRLQCIQVFLCLLTFQSFFFLSAQFHKVNNNIRHHDLILEKDLLKYLNTIQYVTIYCSENIKKIDINLAFGIFLTNVNIKSILRDKKDDLPYIIKTKLKHIFITNENNLRDYKKSTKSTDFQQVLKLLANSSQWVDRLENLVITNQMSYSFDELEDIYSPWKYYSKDVNKKEKWSPNPKLSDMCLISLSSNDITNKGSQTLCAVKDSCYKMLRDGTNFGYALTHRLLLVFVANLGRGCSMFSPKQDKALKNEFCSMAYTEVEYIAINNFKLADLMMEIMCLCSMDGHAQFLRRSWLQQMLHFQKPQGCFGTAIAGSELMRSYDGRRFGFNTEYKNVSNEECSIHATAVASGIFSVAIRYIIKEYY